MPTKPILIASLLFNAVLFSVAGLFVARDYRQVAPAAAIPLEPIAEVSRRSGPAPGQTSLPETRPLRWTDLRSGDEAAYAANLRAIGCPEETIRDILTAAIAHRYDGQRQALEMERRQGRIDARALQTAVTQSWQAQNEAVNRLAGFATGISSNQSANGPAAFGGGQLSGGDQRFGGNPLAGGSQPIRGNQSVPGSQSMGGNQSLGDSTASSLSGGNSLVAGGAQGGGVPGSLPDGIRMPLALSDPPASLGLSPDQVARAVRLGDDFAAALRSANASPTDPNYRLFWKEEQASADARLKLLIGYPAFKLWQTSRQ